MEFERKNSRHIRDLLLKTKRAQKKGIRSFLQKEQIGLRSVKVPLSTAVMPTAKDYIRKQAQWSLPPSPGGLEQQPYQPNLQATLQQFFGLVNQLRASLNPQVQAINLILRDYVPHLKHISSGAVSLPANVANELDMALTRANALATNLAGAEASDQQAIQEISRTVTDVLRRTFPSAKPAQTEQATEQRPAQTGWWSRLTDRGRAGATRGAKGIRQWLAGPVRGEPAMA